MNVCCLKPANPGEPVLWHDGRRPKDGEDEGDAAPDGLLAVEHRPLRHEQLQRIKSGQGPDFESGQISAILTRNHLYRAV